VLRSLATRLSTAFSILGKVSHLRGVAFAALAEFAGNEAVAVFRIRIGGEIGSAGVRSTERAIGP
jgi:hypothetical protein